MLPHLSNILEKITLNGIVIKQIGNKIYLLKRDEIVPDLLSRFKFSIVILDQRKTKRKSNKTCFVSQKSPHKNPKIITRIYSDLPIIKKIVSQFNETPNFYYVILCDGHLIEYNELMDYKGDHCVDLKNFYVEELNKFIKSYVKPRIRMQMTTFNRAFKDWLGPYYFLDLKSDCYKKALKECGVRPLGTLIKGKQMYSIE